MGRSMATSVSTTGDEIGLRVLTLNCWGVPPPGSKDSDRRFDLIGRYFAHNDVEYDILLFQEVWLAKHHEMLIRHLGNRYPHQHYFYSGFIGSGCCIFTKLKIVDVFMHHYSLNGYLTFQIIPVRNLILGFILQS